MLSELQKILIGGLKIRGLEQDDILATMLILKTEEQQWAMAEYLETVMDNPPDRTIVFGEAVKIAYNNRHTG